MVKPCKIIVNIDPKGKNRRRIPTKNGLSIDSGLSIDEAVTASHNCLSLRDCYSCEICGLFCPELCITRNEETDRIEIDLDYCKGCGICAFVCPKGAIRMVLEKGI